MKIKVFILRSDGIIQRYRIKKKNLYRKYKRYSTINNRVVWTKKEVEILYHIHIVYYASYKHNLPRMAREFEIHHFRVFNQLPTKKELLEIYDNIVDHLMNYYGLVFADRDLENTKITKIGYEILRAKKVVRELCTLQTIVFYDYRGYIYPLNLETYTRDFPNTHAIRNHRIGIDVDTKDLTKVKQIRKQISKKFKIPLSKIEIRKSTNNYHIVIHKKHSIQKCFKIREQYDDKNRLNLDIQRYNHGLEIAIDILFNKKFELEK